MKKKKWILLVIGVLLVAAGAIYYYRIYLPSQVASTPIYNTSKVRVGDIVITTSGVGNIIPEEKVAIGFQTSGILKSLNVGIGDNVEEGDILANLDDADAGQKLDQAEGNLHAFFSPKSINQVELSLLDAQEKVNKAQSDLVDLIGEDGYNQVAALADAQSQLDQLRTSASSSEDEIELAEEAIAAAEEDLNATLALYTSEDGVALAVAQYMAAEFSLREIEVYLQVLKNGPDELDVEINPSPGGELSKLLQAKWDYDKAVEDLGKTVLTAPISGTITEINSNVGQAVNNSPLLTIETLDDIALKFYVEERDLGLLAIGQPVQVTFDAYPNEILDGSITLIEPALNTFEGSSVAVVWAELNAPVDMPLMSGMSADVEVIAAETRDALLVPIQALREISPGSYSVFVVQPDGSLRMVIVTVGLQDYANAEILSGLEQGDIVSTGSVETK
jgi:multidrug efflux pump subunit AcrA (membrane-fusion protein)